MDRALTTARTARLTTLALALLLLLPAGAGGQDFQIRPRAGIENPRGIGPEGPDRRCGTADDFDGIANNPDLRGPDGTCDTADDLRLFRWGTPFGRPGCFTTDPDDTECNDVPNCAGDMGQKSAEWTLSQVVDLPNCRVTSTLTNTSNGEPNCPNRGCICAWSSPRLPELQEAVRGSLDVAPGASISATDGPGPGRRCKIVQAAYRMRWNPETDPSALLFLGGPRDGCGPIDEPGSTLLFPYFEVDLSSSTGKTTLASVSNASAGTRLARVTLWTDWAVPTLSFYLALTGFDVQTINLRDLFSGDLPQTAGAGGGLDCPGEWLSPELTNLELASLRADHTGGQNPQLGTCAGSDRGDSIARGYMTVDHIDACRSEPTVTTGGPDADPPGPRPPADGDPAPLWGDYFFVDPDGNFAQSEPAVSLPHDPEAFGAGSYTFYGRSFGFNGSDAVPPLASTYLARYLNGGPFDGGTTLVIWRDTVSSPAQREPCGSAPAFWDDLGASVVLFDEEENAVLLDDLSQLCPAAAEAVAFECPVAASPFPFGFAALSFDDNHLTPTQAWVTSTLTASGRFSVNHTAARGDDLCGERGIVPLELEVPPPPEGIFVGAER